MQEYSNSTLIIKQLTTLQNDNQAKILSGFFKTKPGEYGEGDCFLGIKVPVTRKIIQSAPLLKIEELEPLITSKWHEIRLAGLLMLIRIFKQNINILKKEKNNNIINNPCYDFYISNTKCINNWDLVDISCPTIVGEWLFYLKSKQIDILPKLKALSSSSNLWEQRIAIVSTLYFVRKNDFQPTLAILNENLYHKHDLIQKANGWLLREIGKKDMATEERFLLTNGIYKTIPRTTLRYAIEKFEETKRMKYLKGTI